jgi:hypothetical protein
LLLQAETVFTFNQPNHWTEESPKSSTKLYWNLLHNIVIFDLCIPLSTQ